MIVSLIFTLIEWCKPLGMFSLFEVIITPDIFNLSIASSKLIFSILKIILILILSPLSGLAYSLSCLITLVVSAIILSPISITLLRLKRSSGSSKVKTILFSESFTLANFIFYLYPINQFFILFLGLQIVFKPVFS